MSPTKSVLMTQPSILLEDFSPVPWVASIITESARCTLSQITVNYGRSSINCPAPMVWAGAKTVHSCDLFPSAPLAVLIFRYLTDSWNKDILAFNYDVVRHTSSVSDHG